jgi:hypothetical protein
VLKEWISLALGRRALTRDLDHWEASIYLVQDISNRFPERHRNPVHIYFTRQILGDLGSAIEDIIIIIIIITITIKG